MSRVHTFMLLVLAFTVGMSMINSMHIFKAASPTINVSYISDPRVKDLSSSSGISDGISDILGIGFFTKAIGFVWESFKGLLYLEPLADQYHIPAEIYIPFQIMVWFSEGWLLVQLWLKFSTKNTD